MVMRAVFLITFFLCLGCSPGKWWGEDAPPPKVVDNPEKISDCPAAGKIFSGTEEESARAMACLEADINDTWLKVQGAQQNTLSVREINVLVNRGVLDLADGDRRISRKKVQALKMLLGIKHDIMRADTDDLLSWARANRQELRVTYQKITKEDKPIAYKDIRSILGLLSSYLRTRRIDIPREDLGGALRDLLSDSPTASVIPESALVAYDVLGALCPGHAESQAWNGVILSECFDSLANDLATGEEWINFMLDQRPGGIYTRGIHDSLQVFSRTVEHRVSRQGLDGLHPELWVNLAAKFKAQPPENFLASLNAIKAFEPQSSGKFFHPKVINVAFRVIEGMHRNLLTALPFYEVVMSSGGCENGPVKAWRECILKEANYQNDALKIINKVVSPNFGRSAVPVTGKRFKKILLFQSLADEIVRAFDKDGDGIISSKNFDEDEVTNLLAVALSSVDSVSTFINNFKDRASGLALKDQDELNNKYAHLNMEGLARLVTLAGSDVLVRRTKEERIFLEKMLANIFNVFPAHSLQLDRDAIISILAFVDSFGGYREAYIAEIVSKEDPVYDKIMIDRVSAISQLPHILQAQFPRTYESCMDHGFQRSCGIAFDEILPSADPGGDWTSAKDLDMLTLVAGSMESLLDSCDYNQNGALGSSLFDGNDELDCTVSKITNTVKRLMDSKLVRVKNPATLALMLNGINSIFLTRSFAKAALVRGTTEGSVLGPILTYDKEATLGSIYSLMAEILAKDRVEALKNKEL